MADLGDLAVLLCGGSKLDEAERTGCELSKILVHLRSVIKTTTSEIAALGTVEPVRIAMYGPFLVRSLLEVGITALIGRMDPMRLLVVKRTQESGEYNTQQAWNSAIRWQGDVVDDKVSELWTPKRQYKDMTKALFGDYYVQIFWTQALNKVADLTGTAGAWISEIKAKSINEFASTRREAIAKLYSESSKGVHAEFVVPPGSLYDKMTVSNMAAKSIEILCEMALLVNLLPHIAYTLDASEATELVNGIETIEVIA